MEEKILTFIAKLRKNVVPITMSETLDCLKAVRLTGFDREKFYNTLKATLVKDVVNYPTFDKMFKYYFNQGFFMDSQFKEQKLKDFLLAQPYLKIDKDLTDIENPCSNDGGISTGGAKTGKRSPGQAADDFIRVIQLGQDDQMANLVRQGMESIEITRQDMLDRENAIRKIKVFLEWKIAENQLHKMMAGVDENTRLTWLERLNLIEEMLQEQFEEAILTKFGDEALDIILERTNLNTLDFYKMNENQVAEIKKKITKLAHKLATRISFRETRAKHGRIDIQRTIRKSMATGGIPISPAFKKKKPSRPEIIILCDISGSVKIFSEFMLQFVFSMQTRFIHVRSFVFIDIVDEVTDYFKVKEIDDAVLDMYNNARFTNSDFSNYGRVFIDFCTKYLHLLSKNTTLIILGDARNNYHQDQKEFLSKIKENVGKLIWLNPEPIENWNKEDSIMKIYAPLVDNLFECRNLKQLDEITKNIF